MISYSVYKLLHVVFAFSVVFSLGAASLYHWSGSSKKGPRVFFSIAHGVSLLLMLVAGFGLLARLGLTQGLPPWVYAKIALWIVLGGLLAFAKRASRFYPLLFVASIVTVFSATYLAIFKPF